MASGFARCKPNALRACAGSDDSTAPRVVSVVAGPTGDEQVSHGNERDRGTHFDQQLSSIHSASLKSWPESCGGHETTGKWAAGQAVSWQTMLRCANAFSSY